jgi:hypothetical protein
VTKKATGYIVCALLIFSAILLGILVPGGPVETRNFSHINPLILGAFNTFLTCLGLISLLLVYFIIKRKKAAFIVATLCGVSYFLVYALDLAKIFPVSPDRMPPALLIIEIVGALVSLPLMFFSIQLARETHNGNSHDVKAVPLNKKLVFLIILMILVGIGIIIFATNAAMQR